MGSEVKKLQNDGVQPLKLSNLHKIFSGVPDFLDPPPGSAPEV